MNKTKEGSCIKFKNGYQIDLTIKKTFFQKLKGLLGLEYLEKNKGIVLINCKQVHTFGMKFPIDLIILDKNFNIIKFVGNLKPNRISPYFGKDAKHIIELATDTRNKKVFNIESQVMPVFAQLIHSRI